MYLAINFFILSTRFTDHYHTCRAGTIVYLLSRYRLSMAVACIGIKKKKHFLTEKLLLTNNLY